METEYKCYNCDWFYQWHIDEDGCPNGGCCNEKVPFGYILRKYNCKWFKNVTTERLREYARYFILGFIDIDFYYRRRKIYGHPRQKTTPDKIKLWRYELDLYLHYRDLLLAKV